MTIIKESVESIEDELQLVRLSKGFRINDFSSGIEEYDLFLKKYAKEYDDKFVSATHLLVNKRNADIVAYMTLSCASIGFTNEEKKKSKIEEILFNSFPAIKIGKLAVNNSYRRKYRGIGSLMVTLARGFVNDSNKLGIDSRFIVVDADIENNPDIVSFYSKNGFVKNEKYIQKKKQRTISMRLDIYLH